MIFFFRFSELSDYIMQILRKNINHNVNKKIQISFWGDNPAPIHVPQIFSELWFLISQARNSNEVLLG